MAMPENDDVSGYASAALTYWDAGWRGVLPMDRGVKKWPPSIRCERHPKPRFRSIPPDCTDCISYTGHRGIEPSYADVMAWCEQFPDGNLCLRLPDGVIGIDVDAYGAKLGARALAEAIKRWGPLPPAPRSTSRTDPHSGIRLYRVPPGTELKTVITFPELGIGDIEIVQRRHRYAISWPSIHPEGGTYWWRDDDLSLRGIPTIDELEHLPQTWIDGLKIVLKPLDFNGIEYYKVENAMTCGQSSPMVAERLRQAIFELNLPGQSRHDTTCKHTMALLRLGRNGEPGVLAALETLRGVFVGVATMDRSRTPDVAREEFNRMLTNSNAARELSVPDNLDWMRHIDTNGDAPAGGTGASGATQQTTSETSEPPENTSAPIQGSRPRSHLEEIERGFWDSREPLRMVYQTAIAQMASPWAVLGITAAKALNQVRPNATLPAVIGGPGSLNFFTAIVARSGGGKGAASAASRLLIPDKLVQSRNLGSGEGLVALFGRSEDADDETPTHESLLINVDEVDTLAALNQRTASTTLSVLRSAFMGEALGFSYADKSKRRNLRAHTYRMTLTVSVQPKRAGGLLSDEGGGTPQRFMWFPAKDNRVSMDESWPSGSLALPHPNEWRYPREIQIPAQVRHEIKLNRVKDMNDDSDALDGHALFCREKFAFALAVMDGRIEMTLDDWELSGIAAEISVYTRAACIDELREAGRLDAAERGEIRGVEMDAADVEKKYQYAERVRRVLRRVLDKLDSAGVDGMTPRDLTHSIAYRDRQVLTDSLEIGVRDGLIRFDTEAARWFKI